MGEEQSGELACAQRELNANKTEMKRLTRSLVSEAALDPDLLKRMRIHGIEDQIKSHHRLGAEKKIPLESRLKTKASRLLLVLRLAERYVAHPLSNTLPHDEI